MCNLSLYQYAVWLGDDSNRDMSISANNQVKPISQLMNSHFPKLCSPMFSSCREPAAEKVHCQLYHANYKKSINSVTHSRTTRTTKQDCNKSLTSFEVLVMSALMSKEYSLCRSDPNRVLNLWRLICLIALQLGWGGGCYLVAFTIPVKFTVFENLSYCALLCNWYDLHGACDKIEKSSVVISQSTVSMKGPIGKVKTLAWYVWMNLLSFTHPRWY